MKAIIKLAVGIGLFIAVLIIGLSIFIKFYLTEDRLKSMLIPPAQDALGRKIEIGGIQAGLFSGIVLSDLAIKEADQEADFVRLKRFVLRYQLLPLLQKRLVVNKVLLDSPFINIVRTKSGTFNFESLKVIEKEKVATPAKKVRSAEAAAIPITLSVNKIIVNDARVRVQDMLNEIPNMDANADIDLSVFLGRDISSLSFEGNFNFKARISYGKLEPVISGTAQFNEKVINYTIDILTENQVAQLSGWIKDFIKTPLAPELKLDVTADAIDLDKILAALEQTPESAPEAPAAKKEESKPQAGAPILPGAKAHGEIKIAKILYKGLPVDNLHVAYELKNQVLTVSDLGLNTAGGSLAAQLKLVLKDLDNPTYAGNIKIKSVSLKELLSFIAPEKSDTASGFMQTSFTFNGKGIDPDIIKKTLNLDGKFAISQVKINETPITVAISRLLGLKELSRLQFDDIAGQVQLRKGRAYLESILKGKDLSADLKGYVDLDGKLDLPVLLRPSPNLAEKLKKKALTKFLVDKDGQSTLAIKIIGTLDRPKPILDTSAIKKRAKEKLKQKAIESLEKALFKDEKDSKKKEDAKELLKGIFGN